MNLRERIESDLRFSLEGRWGLPVVLISPDGVRQDTRAGSTDPLMGQILYDIVRTNPETGDVVVVETPVVTLRRSSLNRVPLAGENWIVEIPTGPSTTAPMQKYMLSSSRPPEGGRSIGVIRLYLQVVEQILTDEFTEGDVAFNVADWAFNG